MMNDAASLTISLKGNPRRLFRDRLAGRIFLVMALLSIVTSVAIILSLVTEAWGFISKVELGALWTDGWAPRNNQFDLRTLLAGTTIVTVIAMVVAVPLGMGAAIYLAEYANPGVRRVLKPVLEVLAGIPSVVLGVFALTFISPQLVQRAFSGASQSNFLAAGLAVGVLIVPLIASVVEDAMRSVPDSLREASSAMGARKSVTCVKIVLPAAVSGLVAALILAVSRAMGETMIVLIAAGGGGAAQFTTSPLDRGLTMTAAMATQARGTDNVVGADLAFPSLFFVGLLLFLITLGLNVIAGRFVRRVRQDY